MPKQTLEDKKSEFNLRTKTKIGAGEALNLGSYLKELNLRRIGIIVDGAVADLPFVQEIFQSLKKENFEALKLWRYDLNSEPDYASLDRIKMFFLESGKPIVDCFVGIGGGSVIDFAKGLATLMTNPGPALSLRGFPTNINPSLPTIALPTTAGTGSEVTFNAVFINKEEGKKLGINTRNNFPVLAILDPNLILSCPKQVIVSSGVDALVHCLEGYMSQKSDTLTKMFAKEGFGLMFNNLPKALKNPKDIKAKGNLQLGAYLGGLVLLGSGGGPTGALSYSLGVRFKVPHGLAGGVFLPYVVEFNAKKGYDFSDLYDTTEGAKKNLGKKQKSKIFSEKMRKLWKELGVPSGIKSFGVDKGNVEVLLKEAENYGAAFAQNPKPFSVGEGKKLTLKLIK